MVQKNVGPKNFRLKEVEKKIWYTKIKLPQARISLVKTGSVIADILLLGHMLLGQLSS